MLHTYFASFGDYGIVVAAPDRQRAKVLAFHKNPAADRDPETYLGIRVRRLPAGTLAAVPEGPTAYDDWDCPAGCDEVYVSMGSGRCARCGGPIDFHAV